MAESSGSNTMGSYTVLRKLKGALRPPGRVYAALNTATGHPALVVATPAAEYTPSGPWKLRVEAGNHPRPFVAVEVLQAPDCAHPVRELAELADLAAAALESVEGLPEMQRHLESRPFPWRRLWRTHARARTAYLGALAGAVAAGGVALLASSTVRTPAQLEEPEATALAGLSDQALVAPEALAVAEMEVRVPALALEMPKTPFKRQYLVDKDGKCKVELEVPIYGACWVELARRAPCGERAYEHNGKCYWPSTQAPKEPSSTAPRAPQTPAQRGR